MEELRKLPSVDRLLREEAIRALVEEHGHDLTVEAVRQALDLARQGILAGGACPPTEELVEMARASHRRSCAPSCDR